MFDMSTLAKITVGITPGYFHDNEESVSLDEFAKELQSFMEKEYGEKFIPLLVYPAKTVYRAEWGCPENGEDVFVIEAGTTKYDTDGAIQFMSRMRKLATALKTHFKQSTVRLQIITGCRCEIV